MPAALTSPVNFPAQMVGPLAVAGVALQWDFTLVGRQQGIVEITEQTGLLAFQYSSDSTFVAFSTCPAGAAVRLPLGPGTTSYFVKQATAGVNLVATLVN